MTTEQELRDEYDDRRHVATPPPAEPTPPTTAREARLLFWLGLLSGFITGFCVAVLVGAFSK